MSTSGILLGGLGIAFAMFARRARRIVSARGQRLISTVSILACFFVLPYLLAVGICYLQLAGGTSMGH